MCSSARSNNKISKSIPPHLPTFTGRSPRGVRRIISSIVSQSLRTPHIYYMYTHIYDIYNVYIYINITHYVWYIYAGYIPMTASIYIYIHINLSYPLSRGIGRPKKPEILRVRACWSSQAWEEPL